MPELQVGDDESKLPTDENRTIQDDGAAKGPGLQSMIYDIEVENGHYPDKDKYLLARLFGRVGRYFLKDPILEVRKDLAEVQGFADRTRMSMEKENEVTGDKWTLARIQAYLNLARREEDLGKAWNYLNLADVLLTKVVAKNDLDQCVLRLRNWDEALVRISDTNRVELRILEEKCSELEEKHSSGQSTNNDDGNRVVEYCRQQGRAQIWSSINIALSRRVSLMRSFKTKLFLWLIVAIVFSEILYVGANPGRPAWFFPFVFVAVFGGFGGILSASLIKRESIVDTTYVALNMIWTTSRTLLGAAGAMIVFSFALWPGLAIGVDIGQLLSENLIALMSLGIAAGFSEQLYVETLEKSARNMGIAGKGRIG